VYADVALKGISKDALRQQLELAKSVKVDDVLWTIKKYLLPIFDPNSSLGALAVSATKSELIRAALADAGYAVEVRQLQTSQAVDGFADDDEEDDEDSVDGRAAPSGPP